MATEQNTQTGGGSPIIAPSGNGILDSILGLSDVLQKAGGGLLDTYVSAESKLLQLQIEKNNATKTALQDPTDTTFKSLTSKLPSAAETQKILLYIGLAAIVATGAVWLVKKA